MRCLGVVTFWLTSVPSKLLVCRGGFAAWEQRDRHTVSDMLRQHTAGGGAVLKGLHSTFRVGLTSLDIYFINLKWLTIRT